jgi:peptidoglycan/xylan/chitin deacetylase (PgdA/CDA1 family)
MFRRVRPNARTVILCYHRVSNTGFDPYRLCVSTENFSAQMAMLSKRAQATTLDDIYAPSRERRFVVTFDDGYSDNEIAATIAEDLGIPITIFVTSGMLGSKSGFWWDRLASIVEAEPDAYGSGSWLFGPTQTLIDLSSPERRIATRDALHHKLRDRSIDEIDEILGELAEKLGVDRSAEDSLPFGRDALLALVHQHTNVTIGGHTTRHEVLRGRTLDDQLSSIENGKGALEDLLDRNVDHFAYPFGGDDAIDECSSQAARLARFTTAATTVPGSVQSSASPYLLRRRMVMNWGPQRFALQLSRWGLW